MRGGESRKGLAAALSLLLSLLLHLLVILLLLHLPEKAQPKPEHPQATRSIRLIRAAEQCEKMAQQPLPQKEKPTPFAKTDPEQAELLPEQKDFVGKRNARAASDEDARDFLGESTLPSMTGEKKEEIVSFDQDEQQGDLEFDGRREAPAPQAAAPSSPPPAQAAPSGGGTPAISPLPTTPQGELNISPPDTAKKDEPHRQQHEQPQPSDSQPATKTPPAPTTPPALPVAVATPPAPTTRQPHTYHDPSLADQTPPGFRTRERRSRHAGRFVLGRRASLNVAATPKGRYEEEVYRRIAYWWYRACDEHRGDIIPGKIVVSLRLNSRGQLVNMDLVQRSGAGVIQQSFTFGAIRQASLPPMPPAVQEEIVGDVLELIFEFSFD